MEFSPSYFKTLWIQALFPTSGKKPQSFQFQKIHMPRTQNILDQLPRHANAWKDFRGDRLSRMVAGRLDPLQCAYNAKCGVEDATLTLLDTVTRQLDSSYPHTRILFTDFSSAFNTEHIFTLLHYLVGLQVHPTTILSIKSFLQDTTSAVEWFYIHQTDFKYWSPPRLCFIPQ